MKVTTEKITKSPDYNFNVQLSVTMIIDHEIRKSGVEGSKSTVESITKQAIDEVCKRMDFMNNGTIDHAVALRVTQTRELYVNNDAYSYMAEEAENIYSLENSIHGHYINEITRRVAEEPEEIWETVDEFCRED